MGRRRRLDPFEVEITGLDDKGLGRGVATDGNPIKVRFAPPGSRIAVQPAGRRKGVWNGRRTAMVRPPAGAVTPKCGAFGLCGGCQLQELPLDAQRHHKAARAQAAVEEGLGTTLADLGVTIHGPRGTQDAYGYRNKVELSFGVRRFLSEADHAEGLPIEGRFLGFHAPGRFDRVVDALACQLIPEQLREIVDRVRELALTPDSPTPWDVRSHTGFWRHLLLRHATVEDRVLVGIYTASGSPEDDAHARALGAALIEMRQVSGVLWMRNDGVADVARGELVEQWGSETLTEHLGPVKLELSVDAFFQTNTAAAVVLNDTIAEAAGAGGHLVDLYCGTGAIGLYLASQFEQVTGVEVIASAVENARANAARNGIENTSWHVGKVEEALHILDAVTGRRTLVVDPPRVGLHPKVAKKLAGAEAETLVYVACKPGSLGRDAAILAEGGWKMTDFWTVDLFPQTGHMEAIARFQRP